jgi:hypothetical protein
MPYILNRNRHDFRQRSAVRARVGPIYFFRSHRVTLSVIAASQNCRSLPMAANLPSLGRAGIFFPVGVHEKVVIRDASFIARNSTHR